MKRLAEWMNDTLSDSEYRGRRTTFDGPLPEEIASMVRPILEHASRGTILRDEIGRCFGVGSSSKRLIRSGSRNSANIVLQKGRFRFDTALTGRSHRFTATIPDDIPLSLAPNSRIRDLGYLRAISQIMESDRRRIYATNLVAARPAPSRGMCRV